MHNQKQDSVELVLSQGECAIFPKEVTQEHSFLLPFLVKVNSEREEFAP